MYLYIFYCIQLKYILKEFFLYVSERVAAEGATLLLVVDGQGDGIQIVQPDHPAPEGPEVYYVILLSCHQNQMYLL